jgi:hypothetical protein
MSPTQLVAPPDTTPAPGHVVIREGALHVGGEPTYLFGGELQYFRVRDPGHDAARTHALWERALDRMQAAGMNLVSTYVPWDYHSPADGAWDFEGARDLARFLELVARRGMHLLFKPGPLITAEWPRGIGTFGAVPAWFKRAHPEALALRADGRHFVFGSAGDSDQRQPSYLHPAYLDAVRVWYRRALGFARPHLGGALVGIQIDNETNLYWSEIFGDLDYNPVALAHYRGFLARAYGSVQALNRAYRTRYTAFAEVVPPTRKPSLLATARRTRYHRDDPWRADWYFAAQAMGAEYLAVLREMIEQEGFREPDVLLFTNDSPFSLNLESVPLREILISDGRIKNEVALVALDLYPKQFLTNRQLQDQPFQADYFTRLYDHYGDLATGPQEFIFAAELQGGFWNMPLLGGPEVHPEATDQLLARSVGRGLKGAAFYVIQDGLNADGTRYDYDAALDANGQPRERYAVLARWGRLLRAHGARLLGAREVKDAVAILQNGLHGAPRAGLSDHLQRLHTVEQPALFGWLACAGFNPEVLDARMVDAGTLARYRAVFYQNPGFIDTRTAELLHSYVQGGGFLVNLLWPAARGAGPAAARMRALFPARPAGQRIWRTPSRRGRVNLVRSDDGMEEGGPLCSYWYASLWDLAPCPAARPLLRERRRLTGARGRIVGYTLEDALGRRALIGTNVYSVFNRGAYYTTPPRQISAATGLASRLLQMAGGKPALGAGRPRELAWARVAPDGAVYVFVINDNQAPTRVHVAVHRPRALGLQDRVVYLATNAFDGEVVVAAPGAALAARGLDIAVDGHGVAVVVLEPRGVR